MRYRPLGKTELSVSEIGFGCGSQGGLMVRGERADQTQAVARAIELGINYFDTAPSYGDGRSETNLGQVLRDLKADVRVGTKIELSDADFADLSGAVLRSVDGSLQRLGRDYVDLIQLHPRIAEQRRPGSRVLSVEDVLDDVVGAFESLKSQGKIRHFGITGMGETSAILRVIEAGTIETVQTVYNLLNPSAARPVHPGFYAQDFGQLIPTAAAHGVGAIIIRVLAAGALSGADPHPLAGRGGPPMGSSAEFGEDVAKAERFRWLVTEGYVAEPVEGALRFALANQDLSIILVGFSNLAQVEHAVACEEKGPLPAQALDRLPAIWDEFGS